MRDQPERPLDRVVYWIEYVSRHKGALHLRTASRKLNFLQKDHFDVHLVIFFTFSFILYVIYYVSFKVLIWRTTSTYVVC